MKSKICIQHDGKEVTSNQLLNMFREFWKQTGKKVKDVKNVNLYFVPSQNKCYWIASTFKGEEKGEFEV
ncbi:DUF6465 family protein [Clostridium sp. ZS2-4]|uniref:DUF6465 family protein n=1 Tax=Clostridium sp. ZS2-4 TaxID=2987703 RepID=UPI00227BA4D1|nr:DUF6465 family protein [Clostridium sp. ZS2-4]MCY6356445.1 DUF6465 family protein [Clostridium sp. ZS2-4]